MFSKGGLMAPLKGKSQKSPEPIMTQTYLPEPSVGRIEAAIQPHILELENFSRSF
jgi:hypothetical protein